MVAVIGIERYDIAVDPGSPMGVFANGIQPQRPVLSERVHLVCRARHHGEGGDERSADLLASLSTVDGVQPQSAITKNEDVVARI